MIYVMSDLHGRYSRYKKMLEKIHFSWQDVLYMLGDTVDRGDEGVELLRDMLGRGNVIPILGNHEYMAYRVLKKYNIEVTAENYDTHLDKTAIEMLENWMINGGLPTWRGFAKLDKSGRERILAYLGAFELYAEVEAGGCSFVLVHAGLGSFSEDKPLHLYDIHEVIWEKCDYTKQYFKDKFLVTGHTATEQISPEYKGKIYKKNNHIAINCGCDLPGRVGCICLDTLEEFYVD